MTQVIEERIKRWKNKLIDLSKRNRLLNFKPTKVSTVCIIDEIPSEIYHTIVVKEDTMSFLPTTKDEVAESSEEKSLPQQHKSTEFHSYDKEKLEDKHKDLFLQTNLSEKQLEKNLLRISSISSSVMEEQGYNSLFLAVGFLEWYESTDSDIALKSPILLIPVQLNRRTVKNTFTLTYAEEPPILNPALVYKLGLDFGIKLDDVSEDIDKIAPQDIFKKIQNAVQNFQRWKVTNDIYLGLFSFSKFIHYCPVKI